MKRTFAFLFGLLLFAYAAAANADDDAPPSKAERRAAQRLRIMRGALDDFRIVVPEAPETALKFAPRPLLRYNDQTRNAGGDIKGVLDATVWRLGETGRPQAIVTLEIYLVSQGSPLLTYEFVSLTSRKFNMRSGRGVHWMPHSTNLMMTEFDESPVPAKTPKARLVQMRALARRFTVAEKLGAQTIDLRLLAQPIDRYDDADAGIVDGGVFVFANGTNPEMGLLLECSATRWSYGVFRLAGAKLLAQLDDVWILQATKPPGYPVDGPYTATRHAIFLPDDDDGE